MPRLSLRSNISLRDDEEAGVEWMETRRRAGLVHAWEVVIQSVDRRSVY